MSVYVVRPCRALLAAVLAVAAVICALPAASASAAHKPPAHPARHHRPRHAPKKTTASRAAVNAQRTAAVVAPSAPCQDTDLVPAPENLDRVAAATLCLIDQQRADHGLAPLQPNPLLATAATGHSQDMVAADYFDHVSPAGTGPLERLRTAGYIRPDAGFAIAENIAAATGSAATAAGAVQLWMSSPGHRANILSSDYHDTGIGVAPAAPASLGSGPGATYTEDFGTISY